MRETPWLSQAVRMLPRPETGSVLDLEIPVYIRADNPMLGGADCGPQEFAKKSGCGLWQHTIRIEEVPDRRSMEDKGRRGGSTQQGKFLEKVGLPAERSTKCNFLKVHIQHLQWVQSIKNKQNILKALRQKITELPT